MIPKIIHYCWVGNCPKPKSVLYCIESWRKFCPDYRIIEWNESNYDFSKNKYMRQAYEAKKWGFVPDYARLDIVYQYGGIYLDTDVEVFKSFDDVLDNESFWGFEQKNYVATSTIGSCKHNSLIKMFLDAYNGRQFLKDDGTYDDLTNVAIITEILEGIGLKVNGKYQKIDGYGTFYPQTYFSPYDYINCRYFISENTYAMHHFHKSWLSPKLRLKSKIKKIVASLIGGDNIYKLRTLIPFLNE